MKLRTYLKEQKELKKVVVTCRDDDNKLESLINYIKSNGNTGHSFNIVVDPKSEDEKTFGWDGDGSDYIENVKVEK